MKGREHKKRSSGRFKQKVARPNRDILNRADVSYNQMIGNDGVQRNKVVLE